MNQGIEVLEDQRIMARSHEVPLAITDRLLNTIAPEYGIKPYISKISKEKETIIRMYIWRKRNKTGERIVFYKL